MSSTIITRQPAAKSAVVRIPHVTIDTFGAKPAKKALRKDLDAAVYNLAHEEAKVENYTRYPALDADGGPMALPMRRRIALTTVRKRHALALAAYEERYGTR